MGIVELPIRHLCEHVQNCVQDRADVLSFYPCRVRLFLGDEEIGLLHLILLREYRLIRNLKGVCLTGEDEERVVPEG